MKKIYWLLLFVFAFNLQSCEGPEGPPGIDGLDGKDGVDGVDGGVFLSTVLQAQVSFTAENEYQVGANLEINEGDNLLVYIAVAADEEENIIWMPLPQTFLLEEGVVIFNYLFSKKGFSIFLDSSVPPADLDAGITENQIIRVVIVPGEILQEEARVDFSDYNAVMKWLGKEEKDIEKLPLK